MSSSRVIGGTIAVHLPIVLASHGESLLAAFVCGSVVKIVSTRTGLTLHSLAPLAVALSSHSLASDHTESLVGLYANVANPRQLVVATSSARLLFYDIEDGVLLRQTHITGLAKQTTVARVVASGDHVFFFASNATKALFLYSLNMTSFEASVLHALPNGSEFSGVAASPTGDFVAWWHRNDVFVFEAKRSAVSVRTHKSEVQAACFHPRRPLLAIGDRTGRILIWHALDGAGSPVVEQMHWHAHGVNSLLYTGEDGNILLSGGVEDAVVVWQLETHRKLFVPHLGSLGVFSLASSPNGRSYACVCADNSLFVISSHDLRVSKRILGLRTMGPNLMRTYTRMLAGPDGSSVVLTGKPNTLQWYNIAQDSCDFELSVLHAAVVPRGRLVSNPHQKLTIPSRVELAIFGRTFLATLDVRSGHKKFKVTTERTLKIWRPKSSGIGFELGCVVLRPHRKLVSYLAGNPVADEFCSTSNDKTWKLWRVNEAAESGDLSVSCVLSVKFRDLRPSCCSFSSDGSVVAVMWQGGVFTINSAKSGQVLRAVQVANPVQKTVAITAVPSSSLFVGLAFGQCLWCVDCLSMAVRWRLAIKVIDMAIHSSGHVAVIDQSGWLLLLRADSPVPLWSLLASPEALRVQFVRIESKTVVTVLTKTGMMHLFDVPEISDDLPVQQHLSVAGGSVVAGGRFDGLLGPAAVAKKPANLQQSITGRNNVQFPAAFLAETASHVLPSSAAMLSVLLEELVLKKPVAADRVAEVTDYETPMMMELEGDEPVVTAPTEYKLPHHFSTEARGQLVDFFKSRK